MTVTRPWMLGLLLLLSTGCRRSECVPLCEQNARCPGAPAADCKKQCEETIALSRSARCDDELASLEQCWEKRADKCAAGGCVAEQKRYEGCLGPYCRKNPGATGCR